MINLLPPETKSHFKFARYNTALKSWIIASCIGLLGIIVSIASGFVFIHYSTNTLGKQVAEKHQQLSTQKLEETQKEVSEISNSVKLTLQVLQKQVLFSKLISQIGAAMPADTVLQNLTISSTQGGLDLSAVAKDYQSATQVQLNLADPQNKLFQSADIQNISCASAPTAGTSVTGIEARYPCKVSIRALFAKNNQFQYTTSSGATP